MPVDSGSVHVVPPKDSTAVVVPRVRTMTIYWRQANFFPPNKAPLDSAVVDSLRDFKLQFEKAPNGDTVGIGMLSFTAQIPPLSRPSVPDSYLGLISITLRVYHADLRDLRHGVQLDANPYIQNGRSGIAIGWRSFDRDHSDEDTTIIATGNRKSGGTFAITGVDPVHRRIDALFQAVLHYSDNDYGWEFRAGSQGIRCDDISLDAVALRMDY